MEELLLESKGRSDASNGSLLVASVISFILALSLIKACIDQMGLLPYYSDDIQICMFGIMMGAFLIGIALGLLIYRSTTNNCEFKIYSNHIEHSGSHKFYLEYYQIIEVQRNKNFIVLTTAGSKYIARINQDMADIEEAYRLIHERIPRESQTVR